MSEKRYSFGYYGVDVSNPNEAKPCVDLSALVNALPHGSGLDGDYAVSVSRHGNVNIRTEFHLMDGNGSYCGWVPVNVRIYRERQEQRHPLNSPGFYQVLSRKGDLGMTVRAGHDLGEYLSDLFGEDLKTIVPDPVYSTAIGPNGLPARFGPNGWEEIS